ncbi:HI0074 family nucleotidyltransferase substrate-binding subunit [Gracilibacillus kekensis]|uniref:Nucleotidyltransferase substrate binding protein, HI0074 family n=1 Tax=Gracilibacillus kekensis TaxID=1027249 RepID=A0A1M7Q0H1_9BACI|nr:HI0074 family nucleotidyltransferase substrate-binding subunit [Gracilibacillus kekensis]SHN23523.1 nucleotidyltransferase substrate binding protein, HI0074 family [Gracilibacillus kekensis]
MGTEDRKLQQSASNLEKSLLRLEEALHENHDNRLIVDGTIQRFEFTIELYWKTLKRLLQVEGIVVKTPKETLKEAYQVGWLENEKAWLQMLRDRNETFHTYNEELALQIVENIQEYFPEMKKTFSDLRGKGKL